MAGNERQWYLSWIEGARLARRSPGSVTEAKAAVSARAELTFTREYAIAA